MSGGMVGADIEALRLLADKFDEGSDKLETIVTTVESAVPQADGWSGPDAEGFRQEWSGSHLVRLRETAVALSEVAGKVRSNADAQEETSNDYTGVPGGGGPGGTDVAGASNRPGSVWDVFETGKGLVDFGLAGWANFKYGRNLLNLSRALDTAGDAAASATTFIRQGMLADGMGIVGRLGTAGKFMGAAGGVLGIVGGIDQMFNTQYDGWRGGVDRVMGGIGVAGGVATVGMFLGVAAFANPVGIGIAVGAGLVTGAWALGNLVYDNWDTISAFASDPLPYLADGVKEVGEFASDVGNAVGDAAGAVGDFVGGLFG
ncbi:hypothetical protein GCM10010413_01280 [Promicromonospora sukumoe]|uniref:Uncharacterized protein YukE n=1 Tax=Promicromonospora sukumoe TaxID=88382 RepID=A0A7W3JEH8_9MICO|nr:hypothetical protein [Promicromonospora sukumoe]MBA8811383.1 uncharacterized protein YukE [Promicromonospora sukumoe]